MHHILTVVAQTADPVFDLVTAATAAAELNISASDTALPAQITSASQIIATLCNRVFALQTYQERFFIKHRDRVAALPLSRFPVTELLSITGDDSAIDAASYDLDEDDGIIYPASGLWHGEIALQYMAGYDLPDDAPLALARACIEYIRLQRSGTSRDPSIRSISTPESSVSYSDYYQRFGIGGTGTGALPPNVEALIDPFRRRIAL